MSASPAGPIEQSPLKILAVDDDGIILMHMVAHLQEMGHEVIGATTGREALEAFLDDPDIDLVITDQAMPDMTGMEFAREVKQARPGFPVILASGYPDEDFSAPDMRYLGKPFTRLQLMKAIAEMSRN